MTPESDSTATIPDLLPLAADLVAAFAESEYTAAGVGEVLGTASSALARGEVTPVLRTLDRSEVNPRLRTLIRLFFLRASITAADANEAFDPLDTAVLRRHGLLIDDGDALRAAVDIRPIDLGENHWVVSDFDSAGPDRVIGTGQASRTLLQAIPTTPVRSVLDLGTGCGVQALYALTFADHVVATDVTDRALAFARVSAALGGVADSRLDVRRGPWYQPVAGDTFDLIVANPPFVVGPAQVRHTYRDSGLDLDGASQTVITGCVDRLRPGGTAVMLASWVIPTDRDWRARLADWFPDHGVDAWVLQRDVADPALYVGTWLRDEGLDPASAEGQRRSQEWLDRFAERNVAAVGVGFVYLRRTEHPSDVLIEELPADFTPPLGDEAIRYFERVQWLRDASITTAQLSLADEVALEQVATITEDGWQNAVTRLHRTDGPRWVHEIDPELAAVLAGLRHDGLPLGEVVDLYAAMSGTELDADEVAALTGALIRHGIVVPPPSAQ